MVEYRIVEYGIVYYTIQYTHPSHTHMPYSTMPYSRLGTLCQTPLEAIGAIGEQLASSLTPPRTSPSSIPVTPGLAPGSYVGLSKTLVAWSRRPPPATPSCTAPARHLPKHLVPSVTPRATIPLPPATPQNATCIRRRSTSSPHVRGPLCGRRTQHIVWPGQGWSSSKVNGIIKWYTT